MENNDLNNGSKLYIELLKKTLTNWVHGHEEWKTVKLSKVQSLISSLITPPDAKIVEYAPFDASKRDLGTDWPEGSHTMVGMKRLNNLQECIENVVQENVPGDFIETGVWKGGSVIFMRGMLKAFNINDRLVWVADSFEGLPIPDEEKYPSDKGDTHYTLDFLKVSLDNVKANFNAYGLLDNQVIFLKGWFKDTLPKAGIKQLAILRLDGDMYESTMDGLVNLYPLLSVGGYVIVDDYCIPNCAAAINDFREQNLITDKIIDIDGTGAYWKRNK